MGENNGGLKKTLEEIQADKEKEKKEREKCFYEDPDGFIEINKLIVGAIESPKGIMTFVGSNFKRRDYEIVQSRIHHLIEKVLTGMEIAQAVKQQQGKRIITDIRNKGGFRRFLGGGKK